MNVLFIVLSPLFFSRAELWNFGLCGVKVAFPIRVAWEVFLPLVLLTSIVCDAWGVSDTPLKGEGRAIALSLFVKQGSLKFCIAVSNEGSFIKILGSDLL